MERGISAAAMIGFFVCLRLGYMQLIYLLSGKYYWHRILFSFGFVSMAKKRLIIYERNIFLFFYSQDNL